MYDDMYVLSFWVARVLEFLGIISYEETEVECTVRHRFETSEQPGGKESRGHKLDDGPSGAVQEASLAAALS